ncbi:MAG TPA: hypothetical protein PKD67_07135 [Ignavibacteriaceae bacterium]|nr:hypothetical protein [Ignavibacteriaceae bacterium]
MSEMLGNHYFQLKNYLLAEHTYEKLSSKELSEPKILKRLIICYTQTYKLEKALKLFLQLIENDINTIIRTKQDEEFCPCNELISQIEKGDFKYENKFQTYIALGILWMYCNYKTSLTYFKMAINEVPANLLIKKAITVIENYSNQISIKSN